jgi:transcriptional regulator with XRE-family HTH domain
MPETFGNEIRALRKARGLSQRRVAELLGVTTVTVWNWEAGRVAPWEKHRAAILLKLGDQGLTLQERTDQLVVAKLATPADVSFTKRRRLIDNVGSEP